MSDKKSISINPELFKLSNNKTKKQKTSSIPNISSSLKNKFLKKIANSKNEKLKNKNLFIADPLENNEFENSIQVISSLIQNEKKENLHNRSIKQPSEKIELPVMTELSEELQEEKLPEPVETNSYKLNYKIDNEVGYGCLKNGIKPSYRTWMKTKRNNSLDDIIPPTPEEFKIPSRNFMEEEKIEDIVEKEIEKPKKETIIIPQKEMVKKTYKKSYTLGKSKKHKKISILLKNKTIKQKVLDAQKELKLTDIKKIKKYLVDKGLIKIGSNAPTDVLREMYENAKLSGEIKNVNNETLLYNFINEKE